MKPNITPNQHERRLGPDDFIVSKTDTSGRITYANRIFMEIAGYPESELLGVQHNIIRHPDMPRGVFRFLWDTLKSGEEFSGFVKNLCADGGYYWVFANVTPDYDQNNQLIGYYSVRRKPPQSAIDTLTPIYQEMLRIEKESSTRDGPDKAIAYLQDVIQQSGAKDYSSLVLSLFKPEGVA
jgi:PAS domain S-box-containing protein